MIYIERLFTVITIVNTIKYGLQKNIGFRFNFDLNSLMFSLF